MPPPWLRDGWNLCHHWTEGRTMSCQLMEFEHTLSSTDWGIVTQYSADENQIPLLIDSRGKLCPYMRVRQMLCLHMKTFEILSWSWSEGECGIPQVMVGWMPCLFLMEGWVLYVHLIEHEGSIVMWVLWMQDPHMMLGWRLHHHGDVSHVSSQKSESSVLINWKMKVLSSPDGKGELCSIDRRGNILSSPRERWTLSSHESMGWKPRPYMMKPCR